MLSQHFAVEIALSIPFFIIMMQMIEDTFTCYLNCSEPKRIYCALCLHKLIQAKVSLCIYISTITLAKR